MSQADPLTAPPASLSHWGLDGSQTAREGQRGWKNWSRGGARRSAHPRSPHNLLADTTRLAGCGGRLVGVLAVAPISQPILSELQALVGGSLCGPERLKNKLETRVPGKNLWSVRSGRCQVLPPGGLHRNDLEQHHESVPDFQRRLRVGRGRGNQDPRRGCCSPSCCSTMILGVLALIAGPKRSWGGV